MFLDMQSFHQRTEARKVQVAELGKRGVWCGRAGVSVGQNHLVRVTLGAGRAGVGALVSVGHNIHQNQCLEAVHTHFIRQRLR